MKKEKLQLSNIAKDLKDIAFFDLSNVDDWRLSYIMPITLIAVLMGFFTKKIWIGLLIFSFAAYHIVRYAIEYKKYKAKKKAIIAVIDRGDISISVEKLSHIAEETVYEPYAHLGHSHSAKVATLFYFVSGGSWRLPTFSKHYEWSKDYYISSQGLVNVSVSGDEFFFISLQGHYDIAYIYPCKFFELDSSLELKK